MNESPEPALFRVSVEPINTQSLDLIFRPKFPMNIIRLLISDGPEAQRFIEKELNSDLVPEKPADATVQFEALR